MSTDAFGALSNPVRREILSSLLEHPRTVTELAEGFAIGRPAVSEHLQVLVRAGLVTDERRGQHRVYHLRPEPLQEVGEWLNPFERYWRERMHALRDALDEHPDPAPTTEESRT
jgi:DNA-binding transcriptional ArsR family regulator